MAFVHRVGGDHKIALWSRDDCVIVSGSEHTFAGGHPLEAILKNFMVRSFTEWSYGGVVCVLMCVRHCFSDTEWTAAVRLLELPGTRNVLHRRAVAILVGRDDTDFPVTF